MRNVECGMRNPKPRPGSVRRRVSRSAFRVPRPAVVLAVLLGSGCTWLDKVRGRGDAAPTGEVRRVTAEGLVDRLNRQADAVRSVSYESVAITLSGPNIPAVGESMANSSLTAARPRLFLLNAGKNIQSNIVQVGSNEREFWLYGDVPSQDKVYLVCAHEDFPRAAHKLPVPIDPEWAMVALGLSGTDPNPALYRADTDQRRRQYTLTREVTAPDGRKVERTTVFAADEPAGDQPLVRQHLITEPGGRKVIAKADVARVHRVPNAGWAEVPTEMSLEWPEQKFTMTLRLRYPQVNQPVDPALFTRPEVRGVTPVNLADATFRPSVYRGAGPAEPRRGGFFDRWRRDRD